MFARLNIARVFYLLKKHGIRSRSKGPCKRYMIKWKYACEQPIHYFCSTSPNETLSALFSFSSKLKAKWSQLLDEWLYRVPVDAFMGNGLYSSHLILQNCVLPKLSPFRTKMLLTTKKTFRFTEKQMRVEWEHWSQITRFDEKCETFLASSWAFVLGPSREQSICLNARFAVSYAWCEICVKLTFPLRQCVEPNHADIEPFAK